MDITPARGYHVVGMNTGGGDLSLPPQENSRKVNCNQAHYGPVSGGGAEAGVKGCQSVLGALRLGHGGGVDGGSGGRIDRGGGGRRTRQRRRRIKSVGRIL